MGLVSFNEAANHFLPKKLDYPAFSKGSKLTHATDTATSMQPCSWVAGILGCCDCNGIMRLWLEWTFIDYALAGLAFIYFPPLKIILFGTVSQQLMIVL